MFGTQHQGVDLRGLDHQMIQMIPELSIAAARRSLRRWDHKQISPVTISETLTYQCHLDGRQSVLRKDTTAERRFEWGSNRQPSC